MNTLEDKHKFDYGNSTLNLIPSVILGQKETLRSVEKCFVTDFDSNNYGSVVFDRSFHSYSYFLEKKYLHSSQCLNRIF